MLIPRFSLRTIVLVMTACACFSLVLSLAWQGQTWAISVAAAVASLAVVFVLYALTFLVAYALSLVFGSMTAQKPSGSPFAGSQPPPQYVTPIDQD